MKIAGRKDLRPWVLHIAEAPRRPPSAPPPVQEIPVPVAQAAPPAPRRETVWCEAQAVYLPAPMGAAHYAFMGQRGTARIVETRTYPAGLTVGCDDPSGTFGYFRRYTKPVIGEKVFPQTLYPGKRPVTREIILTATWEE